MPSFLKPMQLRRLPFQLLESKDVVAAPWNTQQGVQRYMDNVAPPVTVLPLSMAMNKWKTPHRSLAQTARSVAQLGNQTPRPGMPYVPDGVPWAPFNQAGRPLNQLPTTVQPFADPQPIARGVLDRPWLVDAPTMRSVARVLNDPTTAYGTVQVADARRFPSVLVISRKRR